MNLYELIRGAFPADLERTALDGPEGFRYSYADVEAESARLARALCNLGAKPGDRVTVGVTSFEVLYRRRRPGIRWGRRNKMPSPR